jgi:DNA-binding transcriptional LysR family regulator
MVKARIRSEKLLFLLMVFKIFRTDEVTASVDFDLHRLRLLRELSYRGTISAVAAAMSYSPAAVSQQIAILQREVGTRLIEPEGRRVRLTPQAHVLVAHVEAVLERLEQAEGDMARSRDDVAGTVRVAGFQTAMLTLIPPALTWLREQHPGLRIEVVQEELEVARASLLPHEFDLVIDEVYPGHPRAPLPQLDQQSLIEDPLLLAEADGGPAGRGGLGQYADVPWVMEPPGSPAREWTTAVCREAGFEPDVVYESSDMVIHARLVAAGHAVAFLPGLLRTGTEGARLRRLAPEHHRRVVTTCRAAARDHPAIRAIRDALARAAARLVFTAW